MPVSTAAPPPLIPVLARSKETLDAYIAAAAQLAAEGASWTDETVAAKKRAEREREATRGAPGGATAATDSKA